MKIDLFLPFFGQVQEVLAVVWGDEILDELWETAHLPLP